MGDVDVGDVDAVDEDVENATTVVCPVADILHTHLSLFRFQSLSSSVYQGPFLVCFGYVHQILLYRLSGKSQIQAQGLSWMRRACRRCWSGWWQMR